MLTEVKKSPRAYEIRCQAWFGGFGGDVKPEDVPLDVFETCHEALQNICRIDSRQGQQKGKGKGKDTGLRKDSRDHESGYLCLDGSRRF